MVTPMILNPAEGGTIMVSYVKHPGAKGEDVRFGDDDSGAPGEQNLDGSNRTRVVIAGVAGVVTSVGGTYNEVVIKIDDDPLGRSVRFCENAKVLVKVGQRVTPFTVVAQDALWRKDSYFPNGAFRDLHTNGFDRYGNRIQFSSMVTHTQAQGRALLEPKPLLPNQRQVLSGGNSRRRIDHAIDAPTSGSALLAGSVHTVDEWAVGDLYEGKPWFRIGTLWSHSSTFTDSGTHDLPELVATAPAESGEPEPIEAEPQEPEPLEPAPEEPIENEPESAPTPPSGVPEPPPHENAPTNQWWKTALAAVMAILERLRDYWMKGN